MRSNANLALLIVAGLGLGLASVSLYDIWSDVALEGRTLFSTLRENTLPLLFALGLLPAAWWLSREDRPAVLWTLARSALAGCLVALLLAVLVGTIRLLQGDLRPLDIVVQVAAFGTAAGLLIGFALAELKKTRDEAMREKRLLESLKESVLEGIVIADEDGRVSDWNRGATEIFGYEKEEIIGRPIEALIPERHRKTLLSGLERMDPEGEGWHLEETIELEGKRKSGEEFPAELSLSSWKAPRWNVPSRNLDSSRTGEERYYAAIIRDISERRELQREILQVQEEERRSIGQELHDGVASQLTGVSMMLATTAQSDVADGQSERLQKVRDLVVESCEDIRKLSRGLTPTGLSKGDLPAALHRLSKNADNCSFEVKGFEGEGDGSASGDIPDPEDLPELEEDAAAHLYYIAQEALTNARKYAGAEEIEICLRKKKGALVLEVTDDGDGFDVGAVEKDKSLGLRSIKHRAEVLGAKLQIESSPGDGTCVRCRLPVESTC